MSRTIHATLLLGLLVAAVVPAAHGSHDDGDVDLYPYVAYVFRPDWDEYLENGTFGFPTALHAGQPAVFLTAIADAYEVGNYTVRVRLDGVLFDEVTTDDDYYESAPWNATAGDHTLEITADPNDDIAETNESNNVLAKAFHVYAPGEGIPDLAVTDVLLDGYLVPGGYAEFHVTITNEGGADAGPFSVYSGIQGAATNGADLPRLNVGDSVTLHLYDDLPDEEWYYQDGVIDWSVYVDYEFQIGEDDRADNFRTGNVSIDLPDYTVTAIDIPAGPYPAPETGGSTAIDITIENIGEAEGDAAPIHVYIDGDLADTPTTWYLWPGQSQTLRVYWEATAGNHNVEVQIDPDQAVADADRSNNQATESFSVFPDANVSVDMDDDTPWLGQFATFHVDVANEGNMGIESARVQFLINGELIEEQTTGPIVPGDSTDLEFQWQAVNDLALPGEYVATIIVDPDQELGEEDYSDNKADYAFTLLATPLV